MSGGLGVVRWFCTAGTGTTDRLQAITTSSELAPLRFLLVTKPFRFDLPVTKPLRFDLPFWLGLLPLPFQPDRFLAEQAF